MTLTFHVNMLCSTWKCHFLDLQGKDGLGCERTDGPVASKGQRGASVTAYVWKLPHEYFSSPDGQQLVPSGSPRVLSDGCSALCRNHADHVPQLCYDALRCNEAFVFYFFMHTPCNNFSQFLFIEWFTAFPKEKGWRRSSEVWTMYQGINFIQEIAFISFSQFGLAPASDKHHLRHQIHASVSHVGDSSCSNEPRCFTVFLFLEVTGIISELLLRGNESIPIPDQSEFDTEEL